MKLKRILIALGGLVVAGLLAIAGVWYFVIRSDAPAAVSILDAVSTLPDSGPSARSEGVAASLIGTWTVPADGKSFVGYRVKEILLRVGSNTAVGRTTRVEGKLVFDGKQITEVQITADLLGLKSDDGGRDGHLAFDGLDSRKFPTATFVLTSPIPIEAIPAEGVTIEKTAQGNLTLHGVTRPLSIKLQGQMKAGILVVVGSTDIKFADYDMKPPTYPQEVVSTEDHGILELQVFFSKAAT